MNIVFVCDGNICRSPMAEALLKSKLQARRVDGVSVSSCGLDADPSDTAHPGLRLVIGDAYNLLQNFCSRPISRGIVRRADLILTMEDVQVDEILSQFPDSRGKTFTITSYTGVQGEVVDRGPEGLLDWLRYCYDTLNRCTDRLVYKMSAGPVLDTAKNFKD